MSELLKCPFCGRRAELRHDKDGFSYIVCANDGCYVRTDGHLNEESAINAWNTRTPMANIVEKLEKLPYGRSYHDYAEKGIVHKYLERNDVLGIVKQEINNGLE